MNHWDVVVNFESGDQEVIRGLTQAQQLALFSVFERVELTAVAIEYDDQHEETGNRETVNP